MQWVCEICGLVHDGDEAPLACPVCGAGQDQFLEFFDDGEVIGGNHSVRPKHLDDDDFYGEFE